MHMGRTLVHFTNEVQKTYFIERERIITKKDAYGANSGSHRQHGKNWQKDIM